MLSRTFSNLTKLGLYFINVVLQLLEISEKLCNVIATHLISSKSSSSSSPTFSFFTASTLSSSWRRFEEVLRTDSSISISLLQRIHDIKKIWNFKLKQNIVRFQTYDFESFSLLEVGSWREGGGSVGSSVSSSSKQANKLSNLDISLIISTNLIKPGRPKRTLSEIASSEISTWGLFCIVNDLFQIISMDYLTHLTAEVEIALLYSVYGSAYK